MRHSVAERGGRLRHSDDDYLEGGPEFVAEVAASTASIDLHSKLRVYRRNQIQEYLVWRTTDREIDWFTLRDSDYHRQSPDSAGLLKSAILPGLWLDVPALLRGDLAAVLKTLAEGLVSPEHAAFVERLKSR